MAIARRGPVRYPKCGAHRPGLGTLGDRAPLRSVIGAARCLVATLIFLFSVGHISYFQVMPVKLFPTSRETQPPPGS
jgi:hypothetical protein